MRYHKSTIIKKLYESYRPYHSEFRKRIVNPQKFQNEFESFKKKLGKNIYWFLSLDNKLQWDLLFLWKNYKWKCEERGDSISLRNFIYLKKNKGKFFVSKQKLRETTLNQLIK